MPEGRREDDEEEAYCQDLESWVISIALYVSRLSTGREGREGAYE